MPGSPSKLTKLETNKVYSFEDGAIGVYVNLPRPWQDAVTHAPEFFGISLKTCMVTNDVFLVLPDETDELRQIREYFSWDTTLGQRLDDYRSDFMSFHKILLSDGTCGFICLYQGYEVKEIT